MVGKKKTLPTLHFDLCITMSAPAWEPIRDAPASRMTIRDAGASSLHSHASAWEREKIVVGGQRLCPPNALFVVIESVYRQVQYKA